MEYALEYQFDNTGIGMPGQKFRVGAIAFLSLVATLTALEFSVRMALPAYNPALHLRFERAHGDMPPLGVRNSAHRLIKNSGDYDVTVRFNRYGLRDSRDVANAGPDDYIVVGDSFAFGWGVEENERFSERLRDLTGRRIFNLGISADIDGYERLLDYAARLGARVGNVILSVNMIDDVRNYGPAPKRQAAIAGPDAGGNTLIKMKLYLLARSSLYFLMTNMVNRVDWLRKILIRAGLIVPLENVNSATPGTREIKSTADRLAALARRFNITFLIIPSRALWLGNRAPETDRVHRNLMRALTKRNLDVIDMRPVMEAGGNPMGYHFLNDGHWRAAGHQLAAEAIVRKIGKR
jgi:hypothetical protein